MNVQRRLTHLAIISALTLAACGGGSDESTAATDAADATATTAQIEADTSETPDEPATTTPTTEAVPEPGDAENCADFITVEDVDAVLGVPVEINGSSRTCNFIYADDAVGTFQAFPARRAEEALEVLAKFKENPDSMGGGELLPDDRGFISGFGLVFVVGDSGMVFSMATPDNIGVEDFQTKLQGFADILLTK